MNRTLAVRGWFTYEVLPSQIQAVNPILILIFIPLFAYVVYPAMGRLFDPKPLRRIAIGLFLMVVAFAVSAWIETRIEAGGRPHIVWQVLAYVILTASEVLVSITCLEFSYTQAPPRMKSIIMSFFLLSIAGGNAFTAMVNAGIAWWQPVWSDGSPMFDGAAYYWLFDGVMLAAALGFLVVARRYRGQTYIQGAKPESR